MSEIGDLIKEAFRSCTVEGTRIVFGKQYSPKELRAIHSRFTNDLLDYKIPHYRVVGIRYEIERDDRRVLRLNTRYGMTVVELGLAAQQIIPARLGGRDRELGCFVGENDSVQELPEAMVTGYGEDGIRAFSRSIDSSAFGQIMHRSQYEPYAPGQNVVNGENLRYNQLSLLNTEKPVLLVPDIKVCEVSAGRNENVAWTTFFYMWGTGRRSYSDNTKLFSAKSKVFPCDTVYDLSSVFLCKTLEDRGGNYIDIMPFKRINNDVLTDILREYGEEYSGQ